MRIEQISKSKIRVIFDFKELAENKISVQSFLSGSEKAKRLINAIISTVNKEFNFSDSSDEITYDLFSFSNKIFIIVLTRKKITVPFSNNVLYKFDSLEEIDEFAKYMQKYTDLQLHNTYKLKNHFYILLDLKEKDFIWKKSLISIVSEFKSPILLSSISNAYFIENAQKLNR